MATCIYFGTIAGDLLYDMGDISRGTANGIFYYLDPGAVLITLFGPFIIPWLVPFGGIFLIFILLYIFAKIPIRLAPLVFLASGALLYEVKLSFYTP